MKNSKLLRFTLLSISLALFSGCSHLAKLGGNASKPQDVAINSTPAGATVYLDGKSIGTTPVVASQLDSSKSYAASLMLKGYQIANVNIRAVAESRRVGPAGKSGLVFYSPANLPSTVNVTLKADKDPYKSLTMAAANLDALMRKGKITPDQYKERTAELARFYGDNK